MKNGPFEHDFNNDQETLNPRNPQPDDFANEVQPHKPCVRHAGGDHAGDAISKLARVSQN